MARTIVNLNAGPEEVKPANTEKITYLTADQWLDSTIRRQKEEQADFEQMVERVKELRAKYMVELYNEQPALTRLEQMARVVAQRIDLLTNHKYAITINEQIQIETPEYTTFTGYSLWKRRLIDEQTEQLSALLRSIEVQHKHSRNKELPAPTGAANAAPAGVMTVKVKKRKESSIKREKHDFIFKNYDELTSKGRSKEDAIETLVLICKRIYNPANPESRKKHIQRIIRGRDAEQITEQ